MFKIIGTVLLCFLYTFETRKIVTHNEIIQPHQDTDESGIQG